MMSTHKQFDRVQSVCVDILRHPSYALCPAFVDSQHHLTSRCFCRGIFSVTSECRVADIHRICVWFDCWSKVVSIEEEHGICLCVINIFSVFVGVSIYKTNVFLWFYCKPTPSSSAYRRSNI